MIVIFMLGCMLKPWQVGFLSGFDIFFGQLTYELTFLIAELHDLLVSDATAHVPGQLETFLPDAFGLLVQPIHISSNIIGIQGQEATAKKLA